MEDVIGSVIQTSFSVVVAGFLLVRVEKEIKLLTAAIDQLKHCQTCKLSPLVGTEEEKE